MSVATIKFASPMDPIMLKKGTFVLLQNNDKDGFIEVLMLGKAHHVHLCGYGIKLWGEEEVNDISVLIGKYPKRVDDMPEYTSYPIYEMELERVRKPRDKKTKKYLEVIRESLKEELTDFERLKLLHEIVTALAVSTNMNRDLYIKINDLYNKISKTWNSDDVFKYKNIVRVFANEFE